MRIDTELFLFKYTLGYASKIELGGTAIGNLLPPPSSESVLPKYVSLDT